MEPPTSCTRAEREPQSVTVQNEADELQNADRLTAGGGWSGCRDGCGGWSLMQPPAACMA